MRKQATENFKQQSLNSFKCNVLQADAQQKMSRTMPIFFLGIYLNSFKKLTESPMDSNTISSPGFHSEFRHR